MEKEAEMPLPSDPNSYSNPRHAITTHYELDLTVDFNEKKIRGSIVLHLDVKDESVRQLTLDSRSLEVTKVVCEDSGESLKFEVARHDPNFGSKVIVSIPSQHSKKKLCVRILYSTTPDSSGLQWLNPDQTSGKKYPFLFSQCQPIHARSIMPCQDTPQVKSTYSSVVKCDSKFMALMGALRETEKEKGEPETKGEMAVYRFRQPVPIPSYLLAIVVGDLVSEELGPRSKVWAEKEVVQEAKYEFAETEQMLSVAESLCGKYVWGQYDLLVLPPSFPYGGMENPCLTFVTPTLLAGDRSLANVIAHEISHSWTGNLVTNCNWEHFWLNEGFTMFLERKINQRMAGEGERHLSAILGWEGLKECIKTLGPSNPLTRLIPDLTGIDPDDAFSSVPYEKGHTLLWYLEELVGGKDLFEPFLSSYLSHFHLSTLSSSSFQSFFLDYFKDKKEKTDQIDWDAWFYTPGMPPYTPKFDTSLVDMCYRLASSWKEWEEGGVETSPFKETDLEKFSSGQIIVWLSKMLDSNLFLEKVQKMSALYHMSDFTNSEIKFRFLRLCIQARWQEKVDEVLLFVNVQGRMKFVRPIYRDLYEWEDMRAKTIANFLSHKNSMMHVAVYTLTKDLHLEEELT